MFSVTIKEIIRCARQYSPRAAMVLAFFTLTFSALAQTTVPPVVAPKYTGTPPALGSSCTATAQNRNAPLTPDFDVTIFNIAGSGSANALPPFRARVTCSDGTVGETEYVFPRFNKVQLFSGGARFSI